MTLLDHTRALHLPRRPGTYKLPGKVLFFSHFLFYFIFIFHPRRALADAAACLSDHGMGPVIHGFSDLKRKSLSGPTPFSSLRVIGSRDPGWAYP